MDVAAQNAELAKTVRDLLRREHVSNVAFEIDAGSVGVILRPLSHEKGLDAGAVSDLLHRGRALNLAAVPCADGSAGVVVRPLEMTADSDA